MSSPFETSQEFLEVKGPLYTFANNPFWLMLFLAFTVLIFLWFIYASYNVKSSDSSKSDPAVMSVLILTGLISLAQSAYISGTNAIEAYRQNKSRVSMQKNRTTVRKSATNNTNHRYASQSRRDSRTIPLPAQSRAVSRSQRDKTIYKG